MDEEPVHPSDAATAADLEALSNRIADLACSNTLYDYFHVNAADATLPLNMEMNPFNICIEAGQTVDMFFQASGFGTAGAWEPSPSILIQLVDDDDMVLAQTQSSSGVSSTVLLFRGKLLHDTELRILMTALPNGGSDPNASFVIPTNQCQFSYRIYPECYEVTGEGNCPEHLH